MLLISVNIWVVVEKGMGVVLNNLEIFFDIFLLICRINLRDLSRSESKSDVSSESKERGSESDMENNYDLDQHSLLINSTIGTVIIQLERPNKHLHISMY